MYEGDASEANEALAAFGLKLEDEEEQGVECYPENWVPLLVFEAMGTQWNTGERGVVIGLRYESLPFVMGAVGVKRKDQHEVLKAVRVMEQEALQVFKQATNG